VVLLLVLASRSAGEESGTTMNGGGEDLRSAAEAEEELKRRRKRALLYWDAVVKDDRQLSRFELGDLERKMFSWSVKDIFNRDLFRQQVTYRWSSQSSICLLVFL
jgi:hypothetical protein